MATISKRGGKWFAQVRRKGFTPRYKTFDTRNEAQIWAREQETKIDARQAARGSVSALRMPLRQLIDRYIAEVTITKRSADSERLRLGKMQRHPICNLAIGEVTPAAITAYRDDRLAEVKASTVRRELSLFHHALDTAIKEWGIQIGSNAVATVQMPTVNDRREQRLGRGEAAKLELALTGTRNPYVAPVVRLALETAMRRGEILAIQRRHISWDEGTVHIPQTKTGNPRTIPINEAARSILSAMPSDDEHLFPISANAFRLAWNRLRHRAGLPDLRFHDLRHEAISRFCELGLSIPEVALISGHRDPRMLFRYTHLRPADLAEKLRKMSLN